MTMKFLSVNAARGRAGIYMSLFGVILLSIGLVFGAMIPASTRYSWPGFTHLLFVAIGLSVVVFCIFAAIRNLTYYTKLSKGTLEWGRIDRGSISGIVELSDVQQMGYVEGVDAGFKINLILKSGKFISIGGEYLNGDSDAKLLISIVRENFSDIQITENETVA